MNQYRPERGIGDAKGQPQARARTVDQHPPQTRLRALPTGCGDGWEVMKLRNVSALPRGPGGLVVYLDLLAPYVLLYNLCVLNHVLADPNLFFGHRTLLHNHLFFG